MRYKKALDCSESQPTPVDAQHTATIEQKECLKQLAVDTFYTPTFREVVRTMEWRDVQEFEGAVMFFTYCIFNDATNYRYKHTYWIGERKEREYKWHLPSCYQMMRVACILVGHLIRGGADIQQFNLQY